MVAHGQSHEFVPIIRSTGHGPHRRPDLAEVTVQPTLDHLKDQCVNITFNQKRPI
jgi:hypothetical protein